MQKSGKIEDFNRDLSIAWLKLLFFFGGWIAQSVEQQTENLRVGSSILPLTTILYFYNLKHFNKIQKQPAHHVLLLTTSQ